MLCYVYSYYLQVKMPKQTCDIGLCRCHNEGNLRNCFCTQHPVMAVQGFNELTHFYQFSHPNPVYKFNDPLKYAAEKLAYDQKLWSLSRNDEGIKKKRKSSTSSCSSNTFEVSTSSSSSNTFEVFIEFKIYTERQKRSTKTNNNNNST